MSQHDNTSEISLKQEHHKDKYSGQLKQTEYAFFARPATMLMIARETRIERASICRYVAKLRKKNRIWLVKIGLCHVSGYPAQFLCTDPNSCHDE